MLRTTGTILLFGLLTVLSPLAHADECFCLSHATGAILRGCEAYKAPNDAYPTAVCTDPDTGKKSQQTIYSEWKRIEAGSDRCLICKPAPRGTARELPRGGDDVPRMSR